jgi:hypothetical protein
MVSLRIYLFCFLAGLFFALSLSASQIGTGSVVGSGSLSAPINWNDTFSGSSASGTINGIVVTARILPTLNMIISGSGTLALGNLTSASAATGSVNIEIGTNAVNGASVTARSTNGGLRNTSSGVIMINSLVTDGFADSYRYVSSAAATDSTAPGFAQSATLNVEVNDTVTNHLVYSCTRPQPLTGVDDMTLSIVAQPNAQTPAGDYRDVVIVTVSGNF